MKVEVHATQRFRVPAPRAQVYELLADVPKAYRHFPNMKRVVPLNASSFRMEMEAVHFASISHQVIYACRYEMDEKSGAIRWKPVKDVGNGQLEGGWKLSEESGGTHLEFEVKGFLNIEIPMLLRPMASPFVQGLFRSEIGQFLENLRKVFGS